MTGTQLERAHWVESHALAQLIADAFHDLAVTEWLVPNPIDRRDIMPTFFNMLVDHAMINGAVYVSNDRKAVAVWVYATPGVTPPVPAYDRRLMGACGDYAGRFQTFDKIRQKHRPRRSAHHYMAFLAVAVEHRGKGIGSALLRSYHETLDREGIPAYVEAVSPRIRDLYLRHGYRQSGEPFYLPEGPAMWPMWRLPES
jgi:GNAT superfamily N-acetyltransferase